MLTFCVLAPIGPRSADETAPFTHAGQEVRLRYRTRLVSPVNFKTEAMISVDGGPFLNFGSGWFQKEIPAALGR